MSMLRVSWRHVGVLCAVGFGVGAGLSARAETLQSVVQQALESNPELGAIRFNRHAIDHELTAARGLNLPTIDLRADEGRHRDRTITGLGIHSGDDWHRQRDVSAIVSQRIFDGFEARHEIARQRHRVLSAQWRVTDTANSIALRTVQSYLEVQRAGVVLAAARANVSAHQALLARVVARVDGGRGSSSDETEARSRAANAKVIQAEAENRARDADALFQAVVGRAPGALGPARPPLAALPRTIEVAVAEAGAVAPSVLATQNDAVAAEASVATATSRLFPRLNFEASADRGWGVTDRGDTTTDGRAMLVVRWNLFNGGIDKARIWEAKARSYEATEISRNTQRTIERETRVSWNAMAAARVRVPELRRQLDFARQTRSTYSVQYNGGQRRLLDLLNIQAEVFVAESSLRTEELVGAYNSYRILAAIGRLVPALGLELPDEAIAPPAPTIKDGWRDGLTNWQTFVIPHHDVTTKK